MPPRRRNRSNKERAQIFLAGNGRCHWCGDKILAGERWQGDHVRPLCFDGADVIANMLPIHVRCHKRKSAGEVKALAKAYRIINKRLGVGRRKRKIPSRPFPKRIYP